MKPQRHYRLIHEDDAELAAKGKHVPPICTALCEEGEDPPTVEDFLLHCTPAFPCVVIDSIGEVIHRDKRRF
jgi:hypothetical protein